MDTKKTLIINVFTEINDNILVFLKRGVILSEAYTFIFVANNPDYKIDLEHLPDYWQCLTYPNVHLVIRDNIGHDFGGWNDVFFLPSSSLSQNCNV